jgi:guanylate kinase
MTSQAGGRVEAGGRATRPFPIVLSGPSGVGKSSIVAELLARDSALRLSVSVTTRGRRGSEVAGRDYTYVSREEFAALEAAGALVESALVHGHTYGTPREPLEGWLAAGCDVLLDVDYQGGLRIKEVYPGAVLIFLLPPSWQELEARLRGRRSDAEVEVDRRLANAVDEIAHGERYDYFVVNATLESAVAEVQAIIAAERRRSARRAAGFGVLIGAPPSAAPTTPR